MGVEDIIAEHRAAGRTFMADGVTSFALDAGQGPTILLMHGVPSSSYLYRKMVPELAGRGVRALAFDLPGLGFADRPPERDYSWHRHARFGLAALEALAPAEDLHLVLHDIGGPIGLLMADALGARVRSITLLNTIVEVSHFRKPWVMRPFETPLLGELWLATLNRVTMAQLMRMQGVKDHTAASTEELAAYADLLKREDGGRAFLRIMRSFNTDSDTEAVCLRALRAAPRKQVIWAADDPALTLKRYGAIVQRAAGLERIDTLPGRHFFQEDQWLALSDRIANFVTQKGD